MARFISDSNAVSMRWESGLYATASGDRLWIGLVQNSSIDESTGVLPIRYVGTSTRNVDLFVDGPKDVTGAFSYYPQNWRMFVAALGSNIDSGSPTPYAHVISELNSNAASPYISGALNPFTSFTIEDSKRTGTDGLHFVRTVNGAVVNTITLNGTQGEPLTVDVDYVGQEVTFTSGAPTLATEITTRPYMWRDVRLHIPSGTVIAELKDFSLSINNNLEPPHYLNGSQVIAPPIPLNRDYEFTATLDSTSENTKTFWESYFVGGSSLNVGGGSTFNMMLEVSAQIGAGSREAFFIMSGCKMMDMELPTPQEGVNETSLTIQPRNMVINVNDDVFIYSPFPY